MVEGGPPGADPRPPASEGVPDEVLLHLAHGPAALWSLRRPSGEVRWANSLARQLLGEAAPEPAWWREVRSGAAVAPAQWAAWAALAREGLLSTAPSDAMHRSWPRLEQGQPQMWQLTAQTHGSSMLMMAVPVSTALMQASTGWSNHALQRDLLIREVHHRLKNNLQGVSGLLRQKAALHPQAAPWLDEASGQLQAMAQVYGLQTPGGQALRLQDLVRAIARGVESIFGATVLVREEQAPADGAAQATPERSEQALRETLWAHLRPSAETQDTATALHAAPPDSVPTQVHPDQAGALALVLNELLTNAVKHAALQQPGAALQVECVLRCADGHRELDIRNPGRWPASLDWSHLPPGIQGLGLVKALMPSRGAHLQFLQESGFVCARMQFRPPLLWRVAESP